MANGDSVKPKEVKINAPIDIIRGHYSNAVKVTISNSETILDFAFISDQGNGEKHGELVSRVIVTQDFAKKIADSVNKTLETHTKKQKKD